MQAIKQILFTNWHFMRWVRLGLGIFISVQAIQSHDIILGLLAAFFIFQAITNIGCCGAKGCAVPQSKSTGHKIDGAVFEEIKEK